MPKSEMSPILIRVPNDTIKRLDDHLAQLRQQHPEIVGLSRANAIRRSILDWLNAQQGVMDTK